jgi:alpha-mannosidase
VKLAEKNSRALIFRIYEAEGTETNSEIRFTKAVESAIITDATEEKNFGNAMVSADGKTVSFTLPPWSVKTIMLNFK